MNTRRKIDRAITMGGCSIDAGPHSRRFLRTSLAIAGDFGKIGGLIQRLIHLSIQLQRAFVLGFRAPNR
jgi:hypothetical protein